METTIKQIFLEQVHEPLKHPFVTALHQINEIAAVRVRVILKNGLIGTGAATPNEKVTGDTLKSMLQVMEETIKPQLIGRDLADWENLLQFLQNSIMYNTPAKAAFEIAFFDLRAQLFNTSLTRLLGGIERPLYTDYTVSLDTEEKMVQEAHRLVKFGFASLKIKLGDRPLVDDIQMVKAIAATVPKNVSLRIDANQAWNVRKTLVAAQSWVQAGLQIEFIEQPVKFDDLNGLKRLTAASLIPIMADESVHSLSDARKLIELHACDLVNIKLMKTGGLSQAEQINRLCENAGIHCMIGCMIEARESIAAAVAFAAAHQNVIYVDLDSIFMSAETENTQGFISKKNELLPSLTAGLGFKQQ